MTVFTYVRLIHGPKEPLYEAELVKRRRKCLELVTLSLIPLLLQEFASFILEVSGGTRQAEIASQRSLGISTGLAENRPQQPDHNDYKLKTELPSIPTGYSRLISVADIDKTR